jgi:hypothetical protein
MAKIKEILSATNHGTYCVVEVMLDNDEVADVWVGGEVEAYFDKGKYKAFVKKVKT